VEIATSWVFNGRNGNALMTAYRKKVSKYQPLIAAIKQKKSGYKVDQMTIIVSSMGALLGESLEELAKVSKLPRWKLVIRGNELWTQQFKGHTSNGGNLVTNLDSLRNSALFTQKELRDILRGPQKKQFN
jgi:hypothetical protein